MSSRIKSLLFPPEPRDLPGRRFLKLTLRAAHVLCTGILVGVCVADATPALRTTWQAMAGGTGLLMLLLDVYETGVILLQVRGLVVIAKLLLIAILPWLAAWDTWILAGVVVVSVISSHAPSAVRYFIPVGGKGLKGACTKG